MNFTLQISLLIGIVFYMIIIVRLLVKKKLNLKYTLIWLASGVAMIIITLIPQIMFFFSSLIGIQAPVNLIFVMQGLFVLLILISLTTIVSTLTNQVYRLVQTQALLEKRIRDLENNISS